VSVRKRFKISFLITFICIAIFFLFSAIVSLYIYTEKYHGSLVSQEKPSHWKDQTVKDLTEIHSLLMENHPGVLESESGDKHFRFWLDVGFRKAKDLANSVNNFLGYRSVCLWYVNKFEDSQMRIFFPLNENPKVEWTGFLITYKDGKFFTTAADKDLRFDSLPPDGSELIACDGVRPQILVKQSILQYLGNAKFEKNWILGAAHLFKFEENNPWLKKFQNITVNQNGEEKNYSLEYQSIGLLDWERYHLRSLDEWFLDSQDFEIDEFAEKNYWMKLPTFSVPLGRNSNELTEKLESLIRRIQEIKKPKVLVLDLRNNTGGEDRWVNKFLNALYGKEYVDHELYEYRKRGVRTWRVSAENYMYVKEKEAVTHINGFKKLLNKKEGLFTELAPASSTFQIGTSKIDPRLTRVYVLTDPWTNGSALLFLDQLYLLGNVIHIGRSTSGETPFAETRQEVLSDHLITLNFPIMIRHNLTRESNEVYEPRFKFRGRIKDIAGIQKWLLAIDREITIDDH
jgi:hypothetical protein